MRNSDLADKQDAIKAGDISTFKTASLNEGSWTQVRTGLRIDWVTNSSGTRFLAAYIDGSYYGLLRF